MLNATIYSLPAAAIAATLCLTLAAGLNPVLADSGHNHGHSHGADIGQPGQASGAGRTVEVVMGDNYYEPESIAVKEGETVRFVIKNQGTLVHEFNIGTPEMHAEHQEEMLMMVEHGVIQGDKINHEAMKMDMANGKTMEHKDPNSKLLEPGDNTEIVWTFSTNADLEFACNIPGHYQSGMAGTFNITH